MISFAFLLCSALLLSSGVIAEEETTIDIAKEADVKYVAIMTIFCWNQIFNFHLLLRPQDPIHVEVGKQAAAASIKVLNDLLDGKDYKTAMLDR